MARPTKILTFIMIVLFLGCSLSAMADDGRALTLEQAVQLALENNPTILQATETVTATQADVTGAAGDFLPTLSVNVRGYHQYDSGQNSADQPTQTGDSNQLFQRDYEALDITGTANLTVFDGLSNVASIKGTRLERDAAQTNKSWTKQSLAYEAATRFFQVVKSRELVALEEKNLEQNQMQLEKIETYFNAGKVPVTDLYQQKVEMSKARKQLLEARNALEINRLLLIQILGLSESVSISIFPPGAASDSFPTQPLANEISVKEAMVNRDDLRSQNLIEKARTQDVTKANSGYWPKVDLFASLGSGYSTVDDTTSFSDQISDDQVVGTVGVNLSIPIFDRLDTHAAATKARTQQRIAKLEAIKMKQQVAVDLGQAIEDCKTANEQVEVAKTQVEASELALEAMEERYDVGASSLLELSSTRTDYFVANYDRIDAAYSLVEKRLAVAYQKGTLMDKLNLLYEGESK